MDTYVEKIFDYLTDKENFEHAHEIYQQFPKVTDKLIENFWSLLGTKLKDIAKGTEWKADIFVNFSEKYPQLGFYLRSSQYIRVALEEHKGSIYYGVWINEDKVTNRAELQTFWDNIRAAHGMQDLKNNIYWLGGEYFDEDFGNIQTLEKMLPERREDFASELAEILFKFANEIKEDFEEMNKMIIAK